MTGIEQLRQLLAANVPEGKISDSMAVRLAYASDNSRLVHVPNLVVWPANEAEVVELVKAAALMKVPLCARGRGTATTGASLAERGGVVMSTELMAQIGPLDAATRTITVGPGVLNGELDAVLAPHGLFWPPDPSSRAYCSVGGNLATAAAGPRGARYGGVRENVLALRAVCGDGRVIKAGARTLKSSAGYDLSRLLIGSEGTLAIITEAVLKLVPAPGSRAGIGAFYPDAGSAFSAIERLQRTSLLPAAVEFLDQGCLDLIKKDAKMPKAGALLLIELNGDNKGELAEQRSAAEAALREAAIEITAASPGEGVWKLRSVLSQKLRDVGSGKVNEDVAVPVGDLAGLIETARKAAANARIENLNFGHAAVGNLHINFLFDTDDSNVNRRVNAAVTEVMEFVVAKGGTISGEHGVGIAKREYLDLQLDGPTRELMLQIKNVFDPHGILNPGKPPEKKQSG